METEKIVKLIRADKKSPIKEMMKTAENYYKNDNDIVNRIKFYYNDLGQPVQDLRVSNTKLSHPTFSKIVDQKVNYLLSNEISVTSDNKAYASLVDGYLSKAFDRLIQNVATESVLTGIAWLQVYYNKIGKLSFKLIPSVQVIPIWADGDHIELEGLIRIIDNPDGLTSTVYHYDEHLVSIYEARGEVLTLKSSEGIIGVVNEGVKYDADFGKIPFIAFKYNAREIPILRLIKPLLDDYDAITSDISNSLKETPNAIKVVKNSRDKASEFNHNLNTLKTIFVTDGGDLTVIQPKIDTISAESHLSRLRADIYDGARAVDAQQASMGNTSGVAIKLRYADLDMSCTAMATEYAAALDELLYFINIDSIRLGTGDFTDEPIKFIFNTDIAINETETIQNCVASMQVLSHKSVVAMHPEVDNVDDEMALIDGDFKDNGGY